jgi:GTP cyclohydrolase I
VNPAAAARAIDDFLRALGHEPEGELAETGALVAKAWCEELLEGERADPVALLREGAVDAGMSGPVVLRGIAVSCMCPHHLLPAHGHGEVAYLPAERVAGLGAIARAVHACTRRLVLQEQACTRIAESMVAALDARAAVCRLRLTHTCLLARGAREHEARIETLALRGSFESADRELALSALMGGASR